MCLVLIVPNLVKHDESGVLLPQKAQKSTEKYSVQLLCSQWQYLLNTQILLCRKSLNQYPDCLIVRSCVSKSTCTNPKRA